MGSALAIGEGRGRIPTSALTLRGPSVTIKQMFAEGVYYEET